MERLIHTPEGVRDIYNAECEKKRCLQSKVQSIFQSYGYRSIDTPSFEFFDVFSKEVGTIPSRDLYKFFDREGNTLVLRPDFTPSIARAVSMYFMEEQLPIRLCYEGSVFVNSSSYRGQLKESTEMGVEFLNDDSAAADAELIAMIIRVMLESGLKEFQVSIGQVEYFKSLVEEAHLSAETVSELRQLISIKNHFGAMELLEKQHIRGDLQHALGSLTQVFGGGEVLEQAAAMTNNKRALAAVQRLKDIYQLLQIYGLEKYVVFDFGMLSKYHYYTGIIFQAYTYGTGEAVVTGGRYDRLLEHFGKNAPAVGFTILMDQLQSACERQNIQIPVDHTKTMILYPDFMEGMAVKVADGHRACGMDVACIRFRRDKILDDYIAYGKRFNFGGIVYMQSETETFAINLLKDETMQIDVTKFLTNEKTGGNEA
ncbi:MAG: ATP phosphoribosyltransferase regulatory subunit [Lachnospiraceae bacterium]|nr:ATP phosphoribosyltransferase regulatory subunit [Lachnospiraceae bacterium]